MSSLGRNAPCSCGSGKKFKNCCIRSTSCPSTSGTANKISQTALQQQQIQQKFAKAFAHHQVGQLTEAEVIYRQILSEDARHADSIHLLGVIAYQKGRHELAVDLITQAIALNSRVAEFHSNLGNALKEQGKLSEAIARYEQALAIKPNHPEVLNNLGNALKEQGRLSEAIARYEQALAVERNHPEVLNNLGNALKEQGRLSEAIARYEQALATKPDHPEALSNLGSALQEQGTLDKAIAFQEQALAVNPDFVEARWALAILQIPVVHSVNQDQVCFRKNFSVALYELDKWFDDSKASKGVKVIGYQQPFHLAFQEEDNKPLLSQYGSLCNRLMAYWQNLHGDSCGLASTEGRIKVGIASNHFIDHSVWNALIKGWMLHFDQSRFELHVFYLGTKHDPETALARSTATTFIQGYSSLSQWTEAILEHQIDALIFPEIGMDPMTVRLANLRLAPVQLATWGHPETTGLPTIDYYISSMDMEPGGAEKYYTEKLVKLPHLGCCYQQLAVEAVKPDLVQFGMRSDEPLLLCPGTPFKYAPQYDWIFAEIARRLGRCQMVFFIDERKKNLSARLRERLVQAFEEASLEFDNFCVFIPWLDRPAFYGLMQYADVYLDTIGFSGFNTAMQAVECGLPIVTREGRFLRGRLASGILKRMGLSELVAPDEEEYISLVTKLSRDNEYRQKIKERIAESRYLLFGDKEPIRALENFLIGACRPQDTRATTSCIVSEF